MYDLGYAHDLGYAYDLGYAHGLGYALFEEASYSPEDTFLSPSFLDYSIVGAPEVACEPELLHTETASSPHSSRLGNWRF